MKVSNLVVALALSTDSVLSSRCDNKQCSAEYYRTKQEGAAFDCCENCSVIPSRASIFSPTLYTSVLTLEQKPLNYNDCANVCFDEPCGKLCGTDECCLTKCKKRDLSGNTCGNDAYCLKQCLLGYDLYDVRCDNGEDHSGCSDGWDSDQCCLEKCMTKDICDGINAINEQDKRKKKCQKQSSICRFDPLFSNGFDDLGKEKVKGACVIKRGSDDVCNTFGGGCTSDEITLNKKFRLRNNNSRKCLVEEGKTCTENKCNYQLKAERMGEGIQVISECVSKRETNKCDWLNSGDKGCNDDKNQKECLLDEWCSAAAFCSTL